MISLKIIGSNTQENVGCDATRKSHFLNQNVGVKMNNLAQHISTQFKNYLLVSDFSGIYILLLCFLSLSFLFFC